MRAASLRRILTLMLLAGAVGGVAAARGDKPIEGKLKPALLEDPWLVPAHAELQLTGAAAQFGSSPARAALRATLGDRVGVPGEKNRLPLKVHPAVASSKRLVPKKTHEIAFATKERKGGLLFYVKQGDWFVASASLRRAKVGKDVIELLDAEPRTCDDQHVPERGRVAAAPARRAQDRGVAAPCALPPPQQG